MKQPAAGVGGLAALTLTENQLAAAQTVAKVIVQQLTQREQRDFWTEVCNTLQTFPYQSRY